MTVVVVFGECGVTLSENITVRQWRVSPNRIYENSEYVNLGVFKNYCGSFDKNIDQNITKARKSRNVIIC